MTKRTRFGSNGKTAQRSKSKPRIWKGRPDRLRVANDPRKMSHCRALLIEQETLYYVTLSFRSIRILAPLIVRKSFFSGLLRN